MRCEECGAIISKSTYVDGRPNRDYNVQVEIHGILLCTTCYNELKEAKKKLEGKL
jgi:hypothetical protein